MAQENGVVRLRIVGDGMGLLMHSGRLSNPLNRIAKEIKAITSKRKKTDEDHAKLAWLEFVGGMYHDREIGPYIPAANVEAALAEAARLTKRGKDVERAMQCLEAMCPLLYDGPRDPEAMFGDGDSPFVYTCGVSGQGNKGGGRTQRTRPYFREWAFECTILFDPAILNREEIIHFAETAGRLTGWLDGRPRFGKARVEVLS